MNYDNKELLDKLAAEYVVGTLHGKARQRFERLLIDSLPAQRAVAEWQNRMASLAEVLPERNPPDRVWTAIEARLDTKAEPAILWQGWRSVALVSTFLLILVVGLFGRTLYLEVPSEPDQQVAFINQANETPLWLVSMNFETGQLTTQAVSAVSKDLDRVYELWMLPNEGTPQSLGLMPVNGGKTVNQFSPALIELLKQANGLAVSIEPLGGSPTGVPTGPVVYQAQLTSI